MVLVTKRSRRDKPRCKTYRSFYDAALRVLRRRQLDPPGAGADVTRCLIQALQLPVRYCGGRL